MFISIKKFFTSILIATGIITAPAGVPEPQVILPIVQPVVQQQEQKSDERSDVLEKKTEVDIVSKKQSVKNNTNINITTTEKETVSLSQIEQPKAQVEEIEVVTKVDRRGGQCGSANGKGLDSEPKENLCINGGTPTAVVFEDGKYKWQCKAPGVGSDVRCSAGKKVDGACATDLGNTIINRNSPNLCSKGALIYQSENGNIVTWKCAGEYGGLTASCYGVNLIPR